MNVFSILKREAHFFRVMKRIFDGQADLSAESERLVADDFEAAADQFAKRVAFRFEGRSTTYEQFEHRANRVAHWAMAQGLAAGDVVALFMENRPDYVAIWVGLAKIGVTTALINHNLQGEALAHCIRICGARLIITGAEQDEAIRAVASEDTVITLGGAYGGSLEAGLECQPDRRPPRALRAHLRGKDLCLFVYTSGTTGLPKAARLTQARTLSIMRTFGPPCDITEEDRVYITLPLYHSTGGLCGVGQAMLAGATIVLRRRFSASAFWDDAESENVTSIVYIGELCRYLLNQPPHPKERAHKIRTGFGNGLRADVWEAFQKRFGVEHLVEFYGSTEGNVSLMNIDGKVGAAGRIPGWLQSRFAHIAFVKFDVENETPVRGADGFCVRANVDEPGEALGRVGESLRQRFEGYNDEEATQKKLLRDVFEKGDMWFRTGDLLRKDKDGYIYFVDRIGDTFRWKGENVSTNEVGEAFAQVKGVETANVYGVPLPGADGKAGMAAITAQGGLDIAGLHAELARRLPAYAIPLFIRVQKEAETTGTFKYRKVELVKDGFDPRRVPDPLWMYEPEKGAYVPLDEQRFERLKAGGTRF